MDGYAVRAPDVAAAPARLRLIGESAAGHAFAGRVEAGTCVRISTGAPVPAGADCVVIQEDTQRDGDLIVVTEAGARGQHIRRRGFDFAAGRAMLSTTPQT